MKKNIKVRQRDISDCGAACLSSISAYYKLELPVSRIRQMACTDQRGTNVLGMVEAAEKLGFAAKAVKALDTEGQPNLDSLSKVPKPTIAHIVKKDLRHFVVVYAVSPKKITVMDPAIGEMENYSPEEFSQLWTGILFENVRIQVATIPVDCEDDYSECICVNGGRTIIK